MKVTSGAGIRHRIEQLFLMAAVAGILVSVLLPSAMISWMRHKWLWFTLPLDWIEGTQSAVNLVHLILFAALGVATKVAAPQWRFGRVLIAFALLGIGTELLQYFVPGRHPRISDVAVDLVSGLLGWAAIHGWQVRRRI